MVMNGLKARLCNSMDFNFHNEILFLFVVLFVFSFKVSFVLEGGGLQEQRADAGGWGEKWDQNASCDIHKESMKIKP